MRLADLQERVREQLVALDHLALEDRESFEVRPVLNWGGFVNRSFTVTAGRLAYHVKLASDPHVLRGLERWRALSDALSAGYRAPAMRAWIEVPGTPFAGPVFDRIEGASPKTLTRVVRRDATGVVQKLHRDRVLAAELARMGDAATSCATAYRTSYHGRFVEDLQGIRAAPPPFVPPALLEWMREEVESMAERVAAAEPFAAPAAVASHRDLWLDNLLVTPDGALFVLDWDGLALGDPMMDLAMLLGPSRSNVRSALEKDLPSLPFSAAERERFRAYARASLLDWIIDPLSDWVEAAHEPEHGAAIRAANRRVHEEALAVYRKIYA